jgi:hypothetical protein
MHVKQRTAVLMSLLIGIAGTIQYHSTQFLSGFDTFFGDRGDARGFVYFCEHWYQSILGKASLLSPGIFYPVKRTLAYSDLLLGFSIPYSCFRFLGFDMFLSVEFVVILLTFVSYCAAFILLYKTLGFGMFASTAAAMFFAFNNPKFQQTTHLQLQYVWLLPVIFALLITFGKQVETIGQKRAAVLLSLAGLCFNLQMATTFYYAWYLVLWALLFFSMALVVPGTRRFLFAVGQKFWRALLAAGLVLAVGFIPVMLLYLPTIRAGGWYNFDFISEMIPDWRAVLSMGDGNYVWGWFYARLMPDPRPATWGELMVGIGLVPSVAWIVLTILTVWLIKSGRKKSVEKAMMPSPGEVALPFLGILILATSLFYLLGFKYADHSPWEIVYRYFPGAGAIRAVSRYVIFLTLPMSIAFGYVLHRGLQFSSPLAGRNRGKAPAMAILVIAAFGVFEQFGVPKIHGAGFSKSVEELYLKSMAAKLPEDCTAFYLAPGHDANHVTPEYHYDAMLLSIMTRVKTLNASSSQFPRDWHLYFLKGPEYEENVQRWIELHKISGRVCRLEIGPQVEAFDPHTPSPVDDPEFFVRQVYRDFGANVPEGQTLRPEIDKIINCRTDDETCTPSQVALKIFLATGFHERGSFILRMYDAGLRRAPTYEEFIDRLRRFDKEFLLAEIVQSEEFDRVNDNEQAFRESLQSGELERKLANRKFVMLHYYGYLRREPDPKGVDYWVELLNRSGDANKVTEGFINSAEYRHRFRK